MIGGGSWSESRQGAWIEPRKQRNSPDEKKRMCGRRPIPLGIVGWVALGSSAAAAEWPQAEPGPPNVLMIVSDDQGWRDHGFMGSRQVRTPHLDRLAREGAVFVNGSVPTSLCRASLATLLTGRYAHQHKICCNDPPKGIDRDRMLPYLSHAPTIPRLLAQRGYACLQTGKFWEGHYSNGGFTHGMTTEGRHGGPGLAIGRETLEPIDEFLDRDRQGKPFFIWYAPMMPHLPHNPPQRLLERNQAIGNDPRLAKYHAMCEWFDETVGQVLSRLETRGLLENLLVVYVVDNGWVQAEGPPRPNDQFLTRSKNSPYDAGLRTPIIFWRPGVIPPGRYEDLVSTIDLAPTILAACGVDWPHELDRPPGLDLNPRAQGGPPLEREAVFGELFTHDCVELGKPRLSLTHRWIRRGNDKLIVPTGEAAPELYDLATDPDEQTNLAAQRPEVVAELRRLIDAWWDPQAIEADVPATPRDSGSSP